jgi:hypothetical protein
MGKARRVALAIALMVALFAGGSAPGAAAIERLPPLPADSQASTLEPAALGDPSTFVPVAPTRIADTRTALGGVQGPIAGDTTIDLTVVGVGGVPEAATSVVLNVTAVEPQSTGYFTVFPAGATRPDASNLNFVADKTVANLVIARVGANGKVSLYNFGGFANVLFDVTGYFVPGTTAGRFFATVPSRAFDTRSSPRVNGAILPIGPGSVLNLTVRTQLPADSHVVAV